MIKNLANRDNFPLNNFALTCDWLQIHVKAPDNLFEIENPFYYFKRTGRSKVFAEIYSVIDTAMNIKVATYCTGANEKIMKRNYGILKFENSILYNQENLREYVETFLDYLNIKFIGITRFDIAFDFLRFYNNYYPENLIRDFLHNKIIKVNHSSHKGKWGIIGTQKDLYRLDKNFGSMGEHMTSKLSYETLNFGHKTSDINVKLYNKTNELKFSNKLHIMKFHKENFGDTGKVPVWRLEFSLYSMNALFYNDEKKIKFRSLEMLDIDIMYGIFMGLFNKHFQFKKREEDKRVSRMKDITLWIFDFKYMELKYERLAPLFKDPKRIIKTALNVVNEMNNELRNFDENFEGSAKQVISKMIELHDLGQWAKDKGISFDNDENYVNNIYEYTQIKKAASTKVRLFIAAQEAKKIGKENKENDERELKKYLENE